MSTSYLPITLDHHTTSFLKLPSVLHKQPQRLIRQVLQWPVRDAVNYLYFCYREFVGNFSIVPLDMERVLLL
ncbi:MAG: hypothetical protein CL759_00730 [Chloroflexi bacterium]|nr:hypothetical protein [Chloroflexota bacterium]